MALEFHRDSDENNKHTPKGFTAALNNSYAVKSEKGLSVYDTRNVLPAAINFVDGNAAPPTSASGDIYVLIDLGNGTVDAGWGGASYNDWVRSDGAAYFNITPLVGDLCNSAAGDWYKFDGAAWVLFGVGATDTNIANANLSLDAVRTTDMNGFNLTITNGGAAATLGIHNETTDFGTAGSGLRLLASSGAFQMASTSRLGANEFFVLHTPTGQTTFSHATAQGFRIIEDVGGTNHFILQNNLFGFAPNTDPNSKMYVLGQGNDNTTRNLYLRSAGLNDLLEVKNGGEIVIGQTPATDNANNNILVRDGVTGAIELRDATTISGANIYTADGTLLADRTVTMPTSRNLDFQGSNSSRLTISNSAIDLAALSLYNSVGNQTFLLRSSPAILGNYGAELFLGNGTSNRLSWGTSTINGEGVLTLTESTTAYNYSGGSVDIINVNNQSTGDRGVFLDYQGNNYLRAITRSTGSYLGMGTNASSGSGAQVFINALTNGNTHFNTGGNFAIGLTGGATAKLHVKGAGTTALTSALLVQNNNPVPLTLLDVQDGGDVSISSGNLNLNGGSRDIMLGEGPFNTYGLWINAPTPSTTNYTLLKNSGSVLYNCDSGQQHIFRYNNNVNELLTLQQGGTNSYYMKVADGQTSNILLQISPNHGFGIQGGKLHYNTAVGNNHVFGEYDGTTITERFTLKGTGAMNIGGLTATEASALTAANGDIVYATTTDATFTSVGFWGYEAGAWVKL